MSRSLNGLSNVFVNTLNSGDAINIVSTSSTSQSTINVDISKQSVKTTLVNSDLFLLEQADGTLKKITFQNLNLNIDTNFWDSSNDILRPIYSSSSVLVGGTNMNVNNFKFQVEGNSYINGNLLVETDTNTNNRQLLVNGDSEFGDIYMPTNKKIISTNNSNDYLQFGNGTFTNNYSSNIFTNTISFGSTADINLAIGRSITRSASSTDKITFNSGNFTIGNNLIVNNGIIVKSSTSSNSGYVSFFEASDNGTNNIDLHCPLITTHNYNAFLPKITDTNISSVYILSNENIVAGTNVSISGTETITINATDTNTTYSAGTNLSLSGTTFNLDTTLSGNLTFTGSQTFQNTVNITGPASQLGYINLYSNDNNHISLKTATNLGSTFDVILPYSAGTLLTNQNIIPVNKGGTNLTSYTTGEILYASATNILSKLAIGSNNTFLMSNGTNPFWSSGYSFTTPLQVNSNAVSMAGLTGFGNSNQIIGTNGSNSLVYTTLNAGTNISIGATSGSITISSSENYWERNSNVSSFDLQTNSTVDNIVLTVPLSTNNTFTTSNTFVSTSSLKSTLGLISGGGEYIKFVDYSSTKPLELKGIINTPAQATFHMAFKHDSTGTQYPLLKQDINSNLYFHWNALGDKYTFKYNGDALFSGIISPTSANEECFLGFGTTVLTNTFHRTDCVKLKIAPNPNYAAGTEPGFIELEESASSSSNTTRLYFNSASTAYIYWDGTNLLHSPAFAPSDSRLKKNETLANSTELSNAFDKIDIYKYQYQEQYAIDKGADPNKYVYGFIAQNIKENTDKLSSQFCSTGKGQAIYPNNEIDYEGDKLVVDNLLTINKTDMNLLLWGKIKEMDAIIKNQQIVINNLLSATTFANFKKM